MTVCHVYYEIENTHKAQRFILKIKVGEFVSFSNFRKFFPHFFFFEMGYMASYFVVFCFTAVDVTYAI